MNAILERNLVKFKKNKLAYTALCLFAVAAFLSLFSDFLCNNKPILVRYEEKLYFPVLKFYSAETFGDNSGFQPDYKQLEHSAQFQRPGNWMLFPLIPYGMNESMSGLDTPPPSPPTGQNLLGTDDRGRDLLTRLIYGFRNSFLFAAASWVLTVFLAFSFGAVQGYFGGRVDFLGQRFTEVWNALPILYVVVFLLSIVPSSLGLLTAVWVCFGWISLSSYVRAEVLRIRKQEFVAGAVVLGMSRMRVIFRHILPNALTPIITLSPFMFAASIGSLAALDYLGLGLPAPAASWGELLRQGKENLASWWLVFFPVFSLFTTLLLLNFIGEGVREAFTKE